jgi:hypothetical protein
MQAVAAAVEVKIQAAVAQVAPAAAGQVQIKHNLVVEQQLPAQQIPAVAVAVVVETTLVRAELAAQVL